jgi:hypothetical protein
MRRLRSSTLLARRDKIDSQSAWTLLLATSG